MQYHLTSERNEAAVHKALRICYEVLPENGEDSYALRSDEQGAFLCVTDGCGGLGSRRYPSLENHTGAYAASRLAALIFAEWAQERRPAPSSREAAQALCSELEERMFAGLNEFADLHCRLEPVRISGSMQKTLPTTLCAFTSYEQERWFWWAGDSRGCLLDENGLHQYTKDHIRGESDAFESLYRDAPLSNLLCADQKGSICCRKMETDGPSAALVVTDGVYSALPSPMETEMLMLDTLRASASFSGWERRLQKKIRQYAQDDASLLLLPIHAADFDQLKAALLPRREILQRQFITPVRRRRGDLAYARDKWLAYRQGYERTEENDG